MLIVLIRYLTYVSALIRICIAKSNQSTIGINFATSSFYFYVMLGLWALNLISQASQIGLFYKFPHYSFFKSANHLFVVRNHTNRYQIIMRAVKINKHIGMLWLDFDAFFCCVYRRVHRDMYNKPLDFREGRHKIDILSQVREGNVYFCVDPMSICCGMW